VLDARCFRDKFSQNTHTHTHTHTHNFLLCIYSCVLKLPILTFHRGKESLCPDSSLFHQPIFQVQMYQAEEDRRINASGESSREPNRCRRINRSIRAIPSSEYCDELLSDKCMSKDFKNRTLALGLPP
jgi:hypothetical protein